MWHEENGIGYLRVRLSSPDDYLNTWRLDRWLASLGLLSRFPGWREQAGDATEWLWDRETPEGLWDFGPRTSVRLSETWRRGLARQFDWRRGCSCCCRAITPGRCIGEWRDRRYETELRRPGYAPKSA